MSDEQSKSKSSMTPWALLVLVIALAGAAGYWAWGELQRLTRDREQAADAVIAASKKTSDCETKVGELETQLSDLGRTRDELTAQRDELSAKTAQLTMTLEQREEELARLTATSKSLEEKLAAEIKRGDVRVTQSEGRIQVDLIDKVLFDSAQAEISPRGEEVLTRLGAILQTIEDRQIQISGHTDDSPITLPELKAKFDSNWELSTARAVNVVRFLSEKAGVKPGRLVATGYGQYKPVAPNATPKGRAANRRIEVLLLPTLEAKKATLPAPAPAPKK